MPKEMELIRLNAIKSYIKEIKKMRITGPAANSIRARFNAALKKVITEATDSAKEDERSTIMPRDVTPALEDALGKTRLDIAEVFAEIKRLNPIALGELSKLITGYIEEEKKKKT